MNEIYAIDPAAPADARELIHLVRLFGPTEGRFLYDLPYQWHARALALIADEPDVMKKRAMEFMRRRCRAFVQPKRPPAPGGSWIETARTLQPVKALIGPRGCPPTALAIDSILYDEAALPDSRAEHVPRTPSRLRAAAEMLFRISTRVVLVDPYLHLSCIDHSQGRRDHSRFRPVLLELLRAAAAHRTEFMDIFVSERNLKEKGDSDFSRSLARLREEAGAGDLKLRDRVIERELADRPRRRQHARYLLGVGAGLQFDHGFDSSHEGTLNHVHWLSESELRPLLVRFGLPDF